MTIRTHIYISPHFDDAVLSCGGTIWQQVRAGKRVLVVTVFGAPAPDGALSAFAQEMHTRWALADPVASRRKEDAAALALLGAEATYWPYVDYIYRRAPNGAFLCDSEEALFGRVHPTEDALVAELAVRFQGLAQEGWPIYAPLAVGNHVDHQIVHRAMAGLEQVVYYEDYPYAGESGAVKTVLGDGQWQGNVVALSPEALKAKIAAIACYDSQLSSLNWVDAADMASSVRTFAEQTGAGRPAERYWHRVKRVLGLCQEGHDDFE
jgi:LmbE family N-acetylglucosaminyl deacetylase